MRDLRFPHPALASAFLLASLLGTAAAYTGGPVKARILGYDPRSVRVFYELQAFDQSGEPPRTYYFHLEGLTPTSPVHAESLDTWEGGTRVGAAWQQWLGLSRRLVPLHGLRSTEFTVRIHAESTGVDTNWNATRFASHVDIETPIGGRVLELQSFCQPVVRIQGLYTIPGRHELLAILSHIGRSYGCEEVDLPLVILPGEDREGIKSR